jgi:uncharacterized damage-inducible protein DinB
MARMTTIAMKPEDRTDPPTTGDERTLLTGFLDRQRDTMAWKCSGLSDDQLAQRPVDPSGLSLLGMLRHLTEVERGWFSIFGGGELPKPIYYTDERPDDDFDALESHSVGDVYETWLAACAQARETTAAYALDDEGHGRTRAYALRWVLLHLIEEYARHLGHADLIRERIDGAVGE